MDYNATIQANLGMPFANIFVNDMLAIPFLH